MIGERPRLSSLSFYSLWYAKTFLYTFLFYNDKNNNLVLSGLVQKCMYDPTCQDLSCSYTVHIRIGSYVNNFIFKLSHKWAHLFVCLIKHKDIHYTGNYNKYVCDMDWQIQQFNWLMFVFLVYIWFFRWRIYLWYFFKCFVRSYSSWVVGRRHTFKVCYLGYTI